MDNENKECCPKFNPEKWDQKTFDWYNKPFIKETIPTFFHIPFPPMIGKRITKMCKMVEDSKKAEENNEDALLLFRDPSAFKSEIYLSVTGPVLNANNANISGTFIGKVFSGSYNAVPKFIKQMNEYLAAKGEKAKDYYVHYAFCPKCAKKYGNNYMIIFAQV
ncbi:MAG: hydrolase [Candidatus Paceibacterota bacterium]